MESKPNTVTVKELARKAIKAHCKELHEVDQKLVMFVRQNREFIDLNLPTDMGEQLIEMTVADEIGKWFLDVNQDTYTIFWGHGYLVNSNEALVKEVTYEYFSDENGFGDETRSKLNELQLGQAYQVGDLHMITVVRTSETRCQL